LNTGRVKTGILTGFQNKSQSNQNELEVLYLRYKMTINTGPIYGKQYIRYAETWEAPSNNQAGALDVVDVGELRCVSYATWAGPNYAAAGDAFSPAVAQATIVGVNQAYVPTALASPAAPRQMTVATSGLLLIEQDTAAPFTNANLNAPLAINALGQARLGGTAATLDGTTPRIREIVTIGGRNLVLVSFA
jgi:hypothetical protein